MSRQKGFTLIELLVVISIIALLLSILMPSLQRVKKQARAVICQSNLRQWGQIFLMYANDHNDRFMPGWSEASTLLGDMWIDALWSYYGSAEGITLCPEATKSLYTGQSPFVSWNVEGHSAFEHDDIQCSYGMNGWIGDFPDDRPGATVPVLTGQAGWYWRKAGVKRANKVPLFLDSLWFEGYPLDVDNVPPFNGAPFWDPTGGRAENMSRFCIDRHSGYANAVFLDFSVVKTELKDLWKLKWHRQFDTRTEPDWPDWMD